MRLKKFRYGLIIIFILLGENCFSQTANQASATGQIIAEVIPIFSASETAQLNFGRFSPGVQGGEIILSPESTISVLGSVYKGPGCTMQPVFMCPAMLMHHTQLHFHLIR